MTVRAALVPGAPALLPSYAGQRDPVTELRAACRGAVGSLVAGRPTRVVVVASPLRPEDLARGVTTPLGHRVAHHLLAEAGHTGDVGDDASALGADDAVLLVGNGSARRSEKAPGHLDDRAFELDAALERTLRDGVPPPRDEALAQELWCYDLPVFAELHRHVEGPGRIGYSGDPHGVAYWVATWARVREERR